jgi:catechol 2,3-dioxygenase-like lactoylglutathione lyase family enzyme
MRSPCRSLSRPIAIPQFPINPFCLTGNQSNPTSSTGCYGGEDASFSSFRAGPNFLNLIVQPAGRAWSWWGRAIFYDDDVDGLYARLVAAGLRPEAPPRNAEWGERFFHITDPDGHELSFAWPLRR